MPEVFRWRAYRFFFYSNEGNPQEPVHIHVREGRVTAKFWLHPQVQLAGECGFPKKVISQLSSVISARADEIENAWNEHFG
jgi:hypothetical protein